MTENNKYYQSAMKAQEEIRKLHAVCTPEERKHLLKHIHPVTSQHINRLKQLDERILGSKNCDTTDL